MKSHRRKRRRGYTLVFFAMFFFGFMAMAALVIDIGFARLTQRQMQTAADSAALEGLRFRDEIPSSLVVSYEAELEAACGPVDQNDPTWRDCARRWFAAKRVSDTFDDDLDTTDDDGAFDSGSGQFGAGPLVEFTGGAGDPTLAASQLMSVDPNVPVYKPVMLKGSNGSPSASDLQVAIQRGVADAPEADLYSLGPAVPYLFARGSLISRQVIADGITVRATAVANARRAKSVGVASATNDLVGAAPFELTAAFWSSNWDLDNLTPSADTDETIVVHFDHSGSMTRVGSTVQEGHAVFVSNSLTVGDTTTDSDIVPSGLAAAYVPIVSVVEDTDGTMTKRIVAFGLVAVEVAGAADASTAEVEFRLRRSISKVAAENASAILVAQPASSYIDWQNVLTAHESVAFPLLAAASVR